MSQELRDAQKWPTVSRLSRRSENASSRGPGPPSPKEIYHGRARATLLPKVRPVWNPDGQQQAPESVGSTAPSARGLRAKRWREGEGEQGRRGEGHADFSPDYGLHYCLSHLISSVPLSVHSPRTAPWPWDTAGQAQVRGPTLPRPAEFPPSPPPAPPQWLG